MQRWEYAILDCKKDDTKTWRPWMFQGKELHSWSKKMIVEYINDLGDKGWELVGFSHGDQTEYWVFKRQK